MFITKSRHCAELQNLTAQMDIMRVGHLAEVSALKEQISDLRKMVFSATTAQPTPVAREADAILTPINDAPMLDAPEFTREELYERDQILSGTWDEVVEA